MKKMIDEIMASAVVMEKKRLPDGEGGFFNTYVDGREIEAYISLDGPAPVVVVAETTPIVGPFIVTVNSNVELSAGDIIKRVSDGQYFKITSDSKDTKPPKSAGLQKTVLRAERISRLPT